MNDDGVKKQRAAYRSPLRARQAADTRLTVLQAAIELFSGRGWAGTTLIAVAEEAGVAVETIYSIFGSKSALFQTAIDVAIVGDDEEAPMIERQDFAALGSGRRARRLEAAARIMTDSYVRSLPLLRALREAASTEESARARLQQYEDDRRAVIGTGLGLIAGAEVSEEVLDAVWAVASPEVFSKLTVERQWPVDRYEAWMARTAGAIMK